jgi:DNA-binding response OmpR family regulator
MSAESKKSILLVDDEPLTCESFQALLRKFGYQVETAGCLETGYARAESNRFSLILVDLMLGRDHGTTLVHQLRALGIATPILILSAHDSEYYQTDALKSGADDYIVKTTSIPLLIAKLHAHLQREERQEGHKPSSQRRVPIGRCVLDREAHVLEVGDKILKLTEKETKFLDLLSGNPTRVFPVRGILEKISGRDYLMSEEALHAMVGRLRKKLEKECGIKGLIENQHGKGFKIVFRVLSQAG